MGFYGQRHDNNGIWNLKTYYLGPWALRALDPKPFWVIDVGLIWVLCRRRSSKRCDLNMPCIHLGLVRTHRDCNRQ